ncbi:MAG: hypothetical protein WC926_00690 [Candidatus Paceibacterota bacterium]|jgi:hypothetical protein
MMKKIIKSIKEKTAIIREAKGKKERKMLEKKVEQGTDMAIREYGEVFKKLAEYDRN